MEKMSVETLQSAENDQKNMQPEPQSEIQPETETETKSSNTPDLGVAGPAPPRSHVKRRFPRRGYFDVRDASKVEAVMVFSENLMFVANIVFFVSSFSLSGEGYNKAYSIALTTWSISRVFYKWYRVQGGFDPFNSLLNDFTPGAIGLVIALWGSNETVLFVVNIFTLLFDVINTFIAWFQSCIKIPIKGNVKFLRAKQFRDRYEDIGISGLLPCNEATNEIKESHIIDGKYYTLRNVDHETPVSKVETHVNDVETAAAETHVNDVETAAAETLAPLRAQRKMRWIIGTMMVSYSDNGQWVTIKQKAEERAVKVYMERFTEVQKSNFIEMMQAWKERPDQGILKKIGRKRSHCFNLARLIDLTNQGFSVYLENTPTGLEKIKVGAEVDTGVEDFIDSIWEVLVVVCNRAARQKSVIVAIIAVVVVFNLSIV